MTENDLFTSTAFEELKSKGFEVKTKVIKKVVASIVIGGYTFDLDDLDETLSAIVSEDIVLHNDKMIEFFKKHGIIESEGSYRWCSGATKGPNFEAFRTMINTAFKDEEMDKVWKEHHNKEI